MKISAMPSPLRSPSASPCDRTGQRPETLGRVQLRPAFDALLDIDEAMGDVVAKATEPALAAIKLAWWRERLGELDQGKVPADVPAQAAQRYRLDDVTAGTSGNAGGES